MAADAAALAGVPLARARRGAARARSTPSCRANWSHGNPIDIIGDAPGRALHRRRCAPCSPIPATGAVLLHARADRDRAQRRHRARLRADRARRRRARDGLLARRRRGRRGARRSSRRPASPTTTTPEEAVRAFALLATYRRNQAQLLEAPTGERERRRPTSPRRARRSTRRCAEGRELLDESEAKAVLAAYGIPTVATRAVAAAPEAALQAARELGYPVALKILSPRHQPQVRRRRRAASTCATTPRVRDAVGRDARRASPRPGPTRASTGFTVQPMVAAPAGAASSSSAPASIRCSGRSSCSARAARRSRSSPTARSPCRR